MRGREASPRAGAARPRESLLAPAAAAALRDCGRLLLGSRALVWVAGVGAVLLLGFGPTRTALNPAGLTSGLGHLGNVLAAPAARWDGAWYLTIAKYGYLPQLGHYTLARAAFFPLYPMLVSLVAGIGLAGALAGVIVSLLALFAAAYGLHRLLALELSSGALTARWTPSRLRAAANPLRAASPRQELRRPVPPERELSRLAVALLVLCPMAFFLSADYSESLYLALSIGLFLTARNGRFALAGVLGGLAAATRSTGIVLLAPALVLYLYGPREDLAATPLRAALGGAGARTSPRGGVDGAGSARPGALTRLSALARPRYPLRPDALWLLLIPAGLLAFVAFLALSGGQPLAPFHAQALWHREFAGPFVAVFDGARAAFEGARQLLSGQTAHLYFPLEGKSADIEASHNLLLFAFLALAVPATVGVFRRLPLAYGIYMLAALALPLSYPVPTQPLMSLPRFLLVLFPIFMWLAAYLGSRPRGRALVLCLFTLSLIFFTAQFSTWHWVS